MPATKATQPSVATSKHRVLSGLIRLRPPKPLSKRIVAYFVESLPAPSVFADPPRSMRLPSGNWSSRELARNEPSFAWNATTLTLVPAGSESLFQPLRNNTDGDPPSIFHRWTEPSGCVTSLCSQECGLTHSIITTLPSSVTGLFWSNSAENE